METQLKKLNKSHVLQQEQSDCGVACLLAMMRYYGGNSTLEKIRALGGTSKEGTTLLGMYQAAQALGFEAEGCKADIAALIEHGEPVILHLHLENGMQHYVIAVPQEAKSVKGKHNDASSFLISDPAKGVYTLIEQELAKLWVSKTCLTLAPNSDFQTSKIQTQYKQRWLWQLIQEDLGILSISLVLGLMMAVLGLVMAIFSQKLIDDILPSKNINRLILGIVLVALLLSARVGLSAARQWLLNRQSRDFNNRLMHDFFAKLLHLPKSFFDTRKIGDLTTRLHDTARIQRVISQLTNQVLIDVLVIGVSMVFLFFYNVQIALIALCCLPIIFWVIYAFNRLIIDSQREVMQSFAMVESNYIDTIQGISDIKTFDKVDYFNHKNQLKYGTLQDKIFDLGKVQIRLSFLSGITSVAFLTAVLGISSYFVFYKVIELGVLMAILTISGNILSSVVSLALLIIPIQEAKVAFDRIVELTLGSCLHEPKSAVVVCEDTNHGKDEDTNHGKDEDTNHGKREDTNQGNEKLTEITDKKIPLSDIKSLELKNIAYRFAGRSQLLKDINLTTKKGEITTLTGESGSGKSTLLQIIAGFYTSEKGQLLFNETPFSQISMDDFRQKVAYIPQSIKLFNASLLENISLSDSEEELSKVITFCQQYGFEKYFQSLPQGYLTFLGENGIHLSGGQSQLLALARALYHQPQLLLLDESTSAMDKHTEAFIIQLLQSLQTEMIVIWISHKPEINHLGNSVYKIENGLSTLVENKQAQIQDN